jgi:hypothetical protein
MVVDAAAAVAVVALGAGPVKASVVVIFDFMDRHVYSHNAFISPSGSLLFS